MKRIVSDWSTEVRMSKDEAISVCRLGKLEKCCAFLMSDGDGLFCGRMNPGLSSIIFKRLDEGSTNAKGHGGWEGCEWEKELAEIKSTPATFRENVVKQIPLVMKFKNSN